MPINACGSRAGYFGIRRKPEQHPRSENSELSKELSAEAETRDIASARPRQSATGIDDFAVITGIERYQGLPAPEYSAGDALLIKEYFLSLGIPERNIEILLNERATLSGIRKTVESWLPSVINKRGKVFFYFSGHGAPEPQTGESYLVSHDGDHISPLIQDEARRQNIQRKS